MRTVAAAPLDPACPLSPSAGAQAAIVFIKEPSSQDALQGRRALLRCEVEASGSVHVYWLLNGAPVQDTERRFAQGSSLSFAAVDRLQDSGAFQCVARDKATGEEARSANASFNIKCENRGCARLPPSARPSAPEPCRAPPSLQLLPFPAEWGRPMTVLSSFCSVGQRRYKFQFFQLPPLPPPARPRAWDHLSGGRFCKWQEQ